MITFKLSPYGYNAMINFIEYIWGRSEVSLNPTEYIKNDAEWQLHYSRIYGDRT